MRGPAARLTAFREQTPAENSEQPQQELTSRSMMPTALLLQSNQQAISMSIILLACSRHTQATLEASHVFRVGTYSTDVCHPPCTHTFRWVRHTDAVSPAARRLNKSQQGRQMLTRAAVGGLLDLRSLASLASDLRSARAHAKSTSRANVREGRTNQAYRQRPPRTACAVPAGHDQTREGCQSARETETSKTGGTIDELKKVIIAEAMANRHEPRRPSRRPPPARGN